MPVTQEGPDLTVTLLSCPCNRSWRSRPTRSTQEIRMTIAEESAARRVVGGVDTHKDLHVAAVVVIAHPPWPRHGQRLEDGLSGGGRRGRLGWLRAVEHRQR